MSGRYKPTIVRIELRHVREEARFWHDRREHYPLCRGKKHEGTTRSGQPATIFWPDWNVRFYYKSIVSKGGGQSFYWCDICLPSRYRTVADSMRRGGEKGRVIQGEALAEVGVAPRPRNEPIVLHGIPWRRLL